ncbi:MAG TPA: hypothetical protein VK306_15410 [Acidimicrobiales bacterium]|nr:hypothetical protein [Acidimicrobiales bacterium]
MRSVNGDDIPKAVGDTLYTAVGLGVLGFQRMQVRRQELKRSFASALDDARGALDERVRLVEERLSDLDDRVDQLVDSVESVLPEATRGAVRQAVGLAREARHQVFDLVERDCAATTVR